MPRLKSLGLQEDSDLVAAWFSQWLTLFCPGAWAFLTMSSSQGKEVDGLLQPWVNPKGLALRLPGSTLTAFRGQPASMAQYCIFKT